MEFISNFQIQFREKPQSIDYRSKDLSLPRTMTALSLFCNMEGGKSGLQWVPHPVKSGGVMWVTA